MNHSLKTSANENKTISSIPLTIIIFHVNGKGKIMPINDASHMMTITLISKHTQNELTFPLHENYGWRLRRSDLYCMFNLNALYLYFAHLVNTTIHLTLNIRKNIKHNNSTLFGNLQINLLYSAWK